MKKRVYIIGALVLIGIVYGSLYFLRTKITPDDLYKDPEVVIKEQLEDLERLRVEREVRIYTDEELKEQIDEIREIRRNR